jgi:hypothetical protein
MRRLSDDKASDDPVVARAARLVEAFPPHHPSEAQAARVRRALAARPRRRTLLGLRPLAAAMVVLVIAAVASAMVARRWLRRAPTPSVSAPAAPIPRAPAPAPEAAPPAPVATGATDLRAAPAPAARTATGATDLRAAPVHRARSAAAPSETGGPSAAAEEDRSAGAPIGEGDLAKPAGAPDPAREAAIVLAAQRALRVEHAPDRAAVLLDDYLQRYPRGTLAEEALALAIEAAVASDDDARAGALGARYLQRYPRGRFATAAHAAIQRARSGD